MNQQKQASFEAMPKLFQYVIWPAVAGSVAWSFFTVLIEGHWTEEAWAKLVGLAAFAIYLAVDWVSREYFVDRINPRYWRADAFLAPATAIFAIATEKESYSWATWSLVAAFVVAITAHLCGAWDVKDEGTKKGTWIDQWIERWKERWKSRSTLAVINAVGIVVMGLGYYCPLPVSTKWVAPVAIAVVVGTYLTYLKVQRSRSHERLRPRRALVPGTEGRK